MYHVHLLDGPHIYDLIHVRADKVEIVDRPYMSYVIMSLGDKIVFVAPMNGIAAIENDGR